MQVSFLFSAVAQGCRIRMSFTGETKTKCQQEEAWWPPSQSMSGLGQECGICPGAVSHAVFGSEKSSGLCFLVSHSKRYLSGISSSSSYAVMMMKLEYLNMLRMLTKLLRVPFLSIATTSETQCHFKQWSWEAGQGSHPISFPYCAADVPTGTTAQCEIVRFPKEFS